MGFTNSQDLCINCAPTEEKCTIIESGATKEEQNRWVLEVEKLNRTHLNLYKGYPQATAQSFSLALDYCHLAEVEAKTDRDIWMAKIQLAKLKAVWVVDLRGGRKNGRTWTERVKRRCNLVLAGRIDEVWDEACKIETKRRAIIKNRNRRGRNGVEVRNITVVETQNMEIGTSEKKMESKKKPRERPK